MVNDLICDSNSICRSLPVNIIETDKVFFSHEIKKTFSEVRSLKVKGAYIVNGGFVVNQFLTPLLNFSQTSYQLKALKEKTSLFIKVLKSNFLILNYDFYWVIDSWSSNYFHWITEALQKIFLLEKFKGPGVILLPENFKNIAFIQSTLSLIDSTVFYFNPEILVKVNSLITVSYSAPTGNFNPFTIIDYRSWLFKRIKKVDDSGFVNIYISRRKANIRKVINEDAVIEVVKKFGFICLCLEDYSWTQQISFFKSAKYIVSIHGAGLTNCLFSENAKLLEFRKNGDSFNNCYFSLCNILNIEYYYQFDKIIENDNSKDYYIDVELLENNIINMKNNYQVQ